MRRQWLALVACATALVATSGSAQGPSSDTIKPFNGTSLAGWHTDGSAQWRAAGGELVGSAASGPGSLVLDKSYQDIILRFAYPLRELRRRRHAPERRRSHRSPGTTTALYVGLSGADARTLHRVTLDAQGKEVERTNLYKWTARQNPPGMQLRITPGLERMDQRAHPGAGRCDRAAATGRTQRSTGVARHGRARFAAGVSDVRSALAARHRRRSAHQGRHGDRSPASRARASRPK